MSRIALVVASLALAGCGSVAPPLPPALKIPNPVTDLTAVERGDHIVVQFTMPQRTTEGQTLGDVPGVELRIGPSAQRFEMAQWLRESRAITDDSGKTSFEIAAAPYVGKDVVVAVKLHNDRGGDAGWSNFVALAVAAPVPRPAELKAEASPQGVALAWQGNGAPLYRVYRKEVGPQAPPGGFQPLGDTAETHYADTTAEYGKHYVYFVQGLSAKEKAAESERSNEFEITPIDKFAPGIPQNLRVILGAKSVELSWDRVTDPDLAHYRVFRAAGNGAFALTSEQGAAPTYTDRDVASGTRYRYQVTSVDQAGNESAPSAVVEAQVP